MSASSSNGPTDSDLACQARLLQGVSRTFSLTIPQLPHPLQWPVTNAYLLCRIADTIEDEPALSPAQKQAFLDRFVQVIAGREEATLFARDLSAMLSSSTTEQERDLVVRCNRVIRITASLNSSQRAAIVRCLSIMSRGMMEFQQNRKLFGLKDLSCLDRYCYYVAGVVGEMLTELFCDYSAEVGKRRKELLALSVAYAQGLQVTNILKDLWDDKRRGVCWLPRDVFRASGFDLDRLAPGEADPGFLKGFFEIVAIARRHLRDGLRYVLLIPAHETGLRRYLLWSLGLSVLTLRSLYRTPSFGNGRNVNLSRLSVAALIVLTSVLARWDSAVKGLFRAATRGLPGAAQP
jgi:farnesyl-diphosphate farnesyltransferase